MMNFIFYFWVSVEKTASLAAIIESISDQCDWFETLFELVCETYIDFHALGIISTVN